jgi:hypothetical protein
VFAASRIVSAGHEQPNPSVRITSRLQNGVLLNTTGGLIMFDRQRRLLWAGVVMLGTLSALFGDVAAGLQAFRKADYLTAYREWSRAAEQGQAEAQYDLGILYLKGLGVAKNPEEAFRWFRLAAEQGQADAQFQAGLMREKGTGVPKDYVQAQVWFARSADRGDSEAEEALAELYEQGLGVQKDLARAVYWYQQAAEQGHAEAESRLGLCYAAGKGIKKDLSKAYFWLTLASKQKNMDGEKQRLELAKKLPVDVVHKTELSAAQWKPTARHVQNPVR